MSEQNHVFTTKTVFNGFEWADSASKPDKLTLHSSGFLQDESNDLYALRLKVKDNDTVEAAQDLFHGKGRSMFNATQGAGLYVSNTPKSLENSRIYYNKTNQDSALYLLRLDVAPEDMFDALEEKDNLDRNLKMARRVLFAAAWNPLPLPVSPKAFDTMYGDKKFVGFRPSGLQRIAAGSQEIETTDGETIATPLRHGLVRDLTVAEIVATKRS